MKRWRIGVIGAGMIGDWHARIASGLPCSQLVAVSDVMPDRAANLIKKHNLTANPYIDYETMLKGEKLDAVCICTPSGNHMQPALAAMQAGCNVICEKPMEITLDRIDRMIESAEKHRVKLAGVFQNRWNPANRALKDAANAGRFGTVAFAGAYTPWHRSDQYYRDGNWRGTWKLDGGGAIMNQSIHSVDLLQWIAGPVKSVSAYAGSRIHPEIEVEDTLACSLQFSSGAFGSVMGTTAMYPGGNVRIEIGGSDGTAVSESGLKVFSFRDASESDKTLVDQINSPRVTPPSAGSNPMDISLEMHAQNIQHILESWEGGIEPQTNAAESRKAIAIIVAMYESARKGGVPVDVQARP